VRTVHRGEELTELSRVEEITVTGWRVCAKLYEQKPDPLMTIAVNDMNSFEPFTPNGGDGSKMADSVGKYALFRTKVNIPDILNGKPPVIHFNGLWGKGEVWVGGKKRLDFDCEWAQAADIVCGGDAAGETEITVVTECKNKYGGGITSSVVIR
jgi:hypothetical protein